MYATNFEFNGVQAVDMGLVMGTWNGDGEDGEIGCKVTFNTSKPINCNEWNIHGSHYEEPLTIEWSCMKNICDLTDNEDMVITPAEQAYFHRWLECPGKYQYLRFFQDDYEDIYYYCTISITWNKVGGKILGFKLTATCNAPHGYSEVQFINKENIGTGDTFTLYSDSDDIGAQVFDSIEIQALGDGAVNITNDLDIEYSMHNIAMNIDNCKTNEVILINGKTKQITTDRTDHDDLADDYNYYPIRLVNYDNLVSPTLDGYSGTISQNRTNTYTNHGVPCNINLSYRSIRWAVI
jgi:hypothetical protein